MFDILDNPTTFSYVPNTNSRSSSTKKIQKSEYKNVSSIDSKTQNNKNSFFDDILDSGFERDKKASSNTNKNISLGSTPRHNFDSLNINFGDIAKSKQINSNINSKPLSRLSLHKNSFQEPQEDQILNQNFGQTQHTIFNPSKIEDSFISTRNMRPPKNKRQTLNLHQSNGIAFSFDGVIPQEQATITNSSNKPNQTNQKEEKKIKRRSSIDENSDLYDTESITNIFQTNTPNHFRYDSIKEDKHKNHSESNYQSEKQMLFNHEKTKYNHPQIKHHVNVVTEKAQNKNEDTEYILNLKKQKKELIEKYEKDIKDLKEKNEQQMKYLSQNLNLKIKQNTDLREYFIKQTNKVIEEERTRTKKIYEEEINRLKQMLQWEKQRLKSTYTLEIETLKKTITFNNQFNSIHLNQTNTTNKHHWETEQQLKYKALNLNQRQKQLEKRQNDIQFKWQELITTKRYDEQRLRQEQKRLYQAQTAQKKYLMEQKRLIAEQKRKMSVQMGNFQLQYMKRKQEMDLKIKEISLQAQILEKQREQLQFMNQEMMKKHKQQAQEHMNEREKLKELEIQLVKKIQIVELKARSQFYNEEDEFQKVNSHLRLKEYLNPPQVASIKKQLEKTKNTQSMLQINKTKQKFIEIKQNANGKVQLNLKQNKKIDLTRYMQKINHINKTKQYF